MLDECEIPREEIHIVDRGVSLCTSIHRLPCDWEPSSMGGEWRLSCTRIPVPQLNDSSGACSIAVTESESERQK